MNLENEVVVITGAGGGIGINAAKKVSSLGAKVVLADIDEEHLRSLAGELRAEGGAVEYFKVDVTKSEDMKKLVAFTKEKYGKIDVFFNSAGVLNIGLNREMHSKEYTQVIEVNVLGVLNGLSAVLPEFRKVDKGHVVTMVSIGAHVVGPAMSTYAASKTAVLKIMEGARQEEADTKIRFTSISPGNVATDMGRKLDQTTDEYQILTPEAITDALLYALQQPEQVAINEIILRPTKMMV